MVQGGRDVSFCSSFSDAVDREVAEYDLVFLCRARGIRVIQGLIRTSHALRDSFQNAPC